MNNKILFLCIALIVVLYPVFSAFLMEGVIRQGDIIAVVDKKLSEYLLSIWLSWVFLVIIAIYYKWLKKENFFFKFTYIFLLISSSIFGFFIHELMMLYELGTGFKDPILFPLLKTLQNFAALFLFTAFLQAAVWWFTKKWHRK